jgi:hypothetical protein
MLQVKNAINTVCMAGAHFDVKRAELLDILEHFRFGKPLPPAVAELNGIDRLHAEVRALTTRCCCCQTSILARLLGATILSHLTIRLSHRIFFAGMPRKGLPLPDPVLPVKDTILQERLRERSFIRCGALPYALLAASK